MGSHPPIARATAVAAALIALSATPAAAAGDGGFSAPRTLAQVNGFAPAPALGPSGRALVTVSDYAPGRSRILAYTRARGRWARAPRVLRTSGHEIFETVAGFTGDGTGVAAWIRAPQIDVEQVVESRRLPATGRMTPVVRLSPAGRRAIFPRLAPGPGDRALIGWEDDDYGLRLAETTAAGAGPAASLFDRRQFAYDLAYLPDGSAAALSQAFAPGEVQVRLRSRAGEWGEPLTLSGPHTARDARLVAGADGTLAVAWAQYGGVDSGYRVQVSVRPPGGAFSPPRTIDSGGGEARAPGLAVRDDGSLVVAWLAEARLGFLARGGEVRVATVAPDGEVSAIRRASAAGRRVSDAPTVLADRDGDALVTWLESRRLMAATRAAGGRLAPPRQVSPAGRRVYAARVVATRRGEALAAWSLESVRARLGVIQVAEARF